MKTIAESGIADIFHVTSEPGDATRYDYFGYIAGNSNFNFMPCDNTFKYPQQINYYNVADLNLVDDKATLILMARETNCNIFTLLECIRTVKELSGR